MRLISATRDKARVDLGDPRHSAGLARPPELTRNLNARQRAKADLGRGDPVLTQAAATVTVTHSVV